MNEEPNKFIIGGVVVLKSGGHEMTIEKIEESDLHCVWSDGKRTRHEQFRRELLCEKDLANRFHIHFTPSATDIDEAVNDLSNLRSDEMTPEHFREILRRHFMAPESRY